MLIEASVSGRGKRLELFFEEPKQQQKLEKISEKRNEKMNS
jgi:hypothetical protein